MVVGKGLWLSELVVLVVVVVEGLWLWFCGLCCGSIALSLCDCGSVVCVVVLLLCRCVVMVVVLWFV